MKKKMVGKGCALLAAVFMTGVLAGCGGSSSTSDSNYMAASESKVAYEEAAAYGMDDLYDSEYEMDEPMEAESGEPQEVQDTSRKLITTVHLSAETDDFDAFNATIEKKTAALGGYLESVQVYNGTSYYDAGKKQARTADYTIRIPAKNLDAFLNEVQEKSNILSRTRSVEDVTLNYVDIQSHKKALTAERDRLMELVMQAETVEDIIALEERIATVRYEIESIESRLRTYDNQIDYSTIYLSVDEVIHFTPVEPQSAWDRMREGFAESTEDVLDGLKEFVIWFVANLPRLLFLVIVLAILILIVYLVIRFINNPGEKRLLKQEEKRAATAKKAAEKAQKRQEAQIKAQQALQGQPVPGQPPVPPQTTAQKTQEQDNK